MTQLDMSIGPVQQFVRAARRTRDLWAGSYLLSFLSAHAMAGAADAGGDVHVVPDDPLYHAVRHGVPAHGPPRIGTVPNHFQVTVDGADPPAVAAAAERHLHDAWRRVHETVWEAYVAPVAAHGSGTRAIWDRQVGSFWEVTWVAGDGDTSRLLGRRKAWRSHRPPDEGGDACMMMPEYQEISGHVRSAEQQRFWTTLHQGTAADRDGPAHRGTGVLDLRAGERLCAVALVKRLYGKHDVVARALGWDEAAGLPDIDHWPSTMWLAALPWLRRLYETAPDAARAYVGDVRRHSKDARRPLPPPVAALTPVPRGEDDTGFHLDANYWFPGFLADARQCPLPDASTPEAARQALDQQLRALRRERTPGGAPLGGPAVYYALIVADGDKLGELVARLGRARVGASLAAFAGRGTGDGSGANGAGAIAVDTIGVDSVVADHGGVTVYAGGDDVLAMLPEPRALACADALARHYRDSFPAEVRDRAHLSAAVVFAHVRVPLTHALDEGHRLLEDVAKERNNRDSLAVSVYKPGGRHCEWVRKWGSHGDADGAVGALTRLVDHIVSADGAEPGFSSSLLFRVRETLSQLCGWPQWRPGEPEAVSPEIDVQAYLRAEIRQSLDHRDRPDGTGGNADPADAAERDAARRDHADRVAATVAELVCPERTHVSLDPLLLARFVAQGGHEEDHA